jgi:hypothetical protein
MTIRWVVGLVFILGCGGEAKQTPDDAGRDANVMDSSFDAGQDARVDAGHDAGKDAGPADAGHDAGHDSGPGCECSTGPCCDGCNFRPTMTVCMYERTGDNCSSFTNLQKMRLSWYCTGSASTCTNGFTGGAVTQNETCDAMGCGGTGTGPNPDNYTRQHCISSTDPCDTTLGLWQTDACRLSTP